MNDRGWNRCVCCCQFFSPDRDGIALEEQRSLSIDGDLSEEWALVCGRCEELIHSHDWLKRVDR